MNVVALELVQAAVHKTLQKFAKCDSYLIEKNSSERSITHLLGGYLLSEVGQYGCHVDCEFSRNGSEIKRLVMPETIDSGELVARTVYPDIIIHRRGKDGPNILVIEAKKFGQPMESDFKKIRAYREQPPIGLGYIYGLLLVIPQEVGKPWSLRWFTSSNLDESSQYTLPW